MNILKTLAIKGIWSMRNNFFDAMRMIFVSPEFIVFLVAIVLREYAPDVLNKIGMVMLKDSQASWQLLLTIVGSYVGTGFYCGSRILFPSEQKLNKALLEWPSYDSLKIRVYWGMALILAAATITFWQWIIRADSLALESGFWYATSTAIAFVIVISFVYNSWQIKMTIERHS